MFQRKFESIYMNLLHAKTHAITHCNETVQHEIEEAIRHMDNAIESHKTGLPLLPCVRADADDIWHIEDEMNASYAKIYEHRIGVLSALCGEKQTDGTTHQRRIPTCPDCIKIYKEKGLL